MPGRITDRTIQEIRDRIDIVDLVSEYLTLKKTGRSFTGLCPFHSEKTPSFTVDRAKGLFYCFGCQKGGDAFRFLMEIEHLSFSEAAEMLAEKTGTEIERETSGDDRERSKRERLISLCALAAKYFTYVLKETRTGKAARDYLKSRGIKDDTVERFGLGYSPAGWSNFTEFAMKKKYSRDELLASGLSIEGKRGIYDRFRSRIIFPIQDANGKVIAFGGRVIGDEMPKYMNSSESSIYSKGYHLYGLNQAKEAISRLGKAIICEGYTDVIWLHQSGVENAAASLGTALTEKQLRLISRYSSKAILLFDSDAAGRMAAMRGFELGSATNVDVLVAELPEGQDPADFISRNRIEDFQKIIDASVPVIEFKLNKIFALHDRSKPGEREKILNEALEMLSKVESPIVKEDYLNGLFDELNLSKEGVVHAQKKMRMLAKTGTKKAPILNGYLKSLGEIERIERCLLSILVNRESGAKGLDGILDVDDFTLPLHKEVFSSIAGGKKSSRKGLKETEDPVLDYITGLIVEGPEGSSDFGHLILRLKESKLQAEATGLSRTIDEAEEDEKPRLLRKLRDLEDERKGMRLEIRKMIEAATLEDGTS